VDSVLDQGSAFWVELDFAVCGDSTFSVLEEPIRSTLGPGLLGVRVLVADDSTINLEVARRILELEGARVWLARDGQEAVNHLLADPEGFDVVLMDVQMPVLDGHDATRRIRTGLGLTELPVIALTAGISIGEHERAAMAGMNDVVAKPFNPQALIRCIRKHAHANVGAGVPAALPNAFVPQPEDQSPTWPQIEGIDATDVQARLGGDVELFVALLARLLDDFGDLGDAMLSTGPAQMAMRLHNLKGSAGTLGALSIQHAAAKAEQACRDRQTATAATLVGEVSDALAFLRQAAEPVLLASRNEPDSNDAGSTESLEPEALAELRLQLRQFDPSAVARFKTLAPQLKRLLGPDTFSRLQRRIDNLEFSEAVSTLDGV
jgi:CheY-like chemotaxis protein/HPt (histidine-containing phosphotransfer) domain-containing protein